MHSRKITEFSNLFNATKNTQLLMFDSHFKLSNLGKVTNKS